ncbi:family 20 glycosylhydrolase [Streptomyces sp. NPDC048172]|uniref:family 20 glycosylhydrolase n=1 Tax=Streptomyces sp. NPDC048172 TaxID=3365505 RepID=UPI00371CDB2C
MNAVIPAPASSTAHPEHTLSASGPWHIRADPPLQAVADTLRELLTPHLGHRLAPADTLLSGPADGPVLRLTHDDAPIAPRTTIGLAPTGSAPPPDESYELTVHDGGITCRARTAVGAFRAATTAAQLLLTTPRDGALPHRTARDAPRFAWRGLMLDPARTFLTCHEVRRLIDVAALYKLNVVHLHLTDNEGWRLEIPSLPSLTAGPDAPSRDFYSVAEFKDLQEYARRRHVTLVPEIDLPGHCAALRRALPELPDAPAPPHLAGRFPFVPPLDLTDPATHTAVSAVLADVCALTDGPYVHIGADEALGATGESFAASVRALRDLVRQFGKSPVAWQEASRAGVAAGDVLQHWVDVEMMDLPDTAEELAERPELVAAGFGVELIAAMKRFFAPSDDDVARALADGGHVLLSPQSHLYLDRAYEAGVTPDDCPPRMAGLGFPSYRPRGVRHAAEWEPLGHGVPEDRIAGVEATLFAERLGGFDDVSALLLPRLPSVAEAAWCGRAPDWDEYRQRLAHHAHWWRERRLPHFPATDVPWR